MTGENNDIRNLLLGLGSGLCNQWYRLLYWCVQTIVSEDKEDNGKASGAVILRGLSLCRIVYGDPDVYSYPGGILLCLVGLSFFHDVKGRQR